MLHTSDDISSHLRGVAGAAPPSVGFTPPEITRRHLAAWSGMHADTVQLVRQEPFEYGFRGPYHLLIAAERAERYDGETLVEGCRCRTHAFSTASSPSCRPGANSAAGRSHVR